ncbi:MAG: glycine zipper 2TM domain-containing protein [Sphingomonadaceae bacterium]|nr:glycine zipper 2TM domain-containing protein [Sphingomonadaceae bacterium]
MRIMIIAASALAIPLSGCMTDGYQDGRAERVEERAEDRADRREERVEDRAERREDRREWRLSRNDRIYRGRDGRYHCRRDDGTEGLLIGAAAGGLLGNLIAPDGSALVGTLIGAAGGAAIGAAIDRGELRCS